MKVVKIGDKLGSVRPTDRKMKKAKAQIEKTGILPKELPLDKKIYLQSPAEAFERIKDGIQIAIENIKGSK